MSLPNIVKMKAARDVVVGGETTLKKGEYFPAYYHEVKRKGFEYYTDKEVLKLMRSGELMYFDMNGQYKSYYDHDGTLLSHVPYEYMNDEEKARYFSFEFAEGPHEGKTMKQYMTEKGML